ncbi:MAG: hypothetical protein F7C32_02280 [Desulfurococcales archaeon]|nr:hypothetical protein [Desulfurococcales archaeon]
MGFSGGKAGDVAFKVYTIAGIVMGTILGIVSVASKGLQGLDKTSAFIATLGIATLFFVALVPYVRARVGPEIVRGETARAVMIGVLSYYPILYVVWSAIYQLYILVMG